MSSFISNNAHVLIGTVSVVLIVCFLIFRLFYKKKIFLELTEEFGGYMAEGQIAGTQLCALHNERVHVLEKFTTGSGKSQKHWHRVKVPLREYFHVEIKIYKETMFSGFDKIRGGQDIIVGHHKFDELFIIQTNKPEWFKSVLHTHLIDKHIQYANMKMELNSGTLSITHKEKLSKPALRALFELSKLYADAISSKQLEQLVVPTTNQVTTESW